MSLHAAKLFKERFLEFPMGLINYQIKQMDFAFGQH